MHCAKPLIEWIKDLPMTPFSPDTALRFINGQYLPLTQGRGREVLDPATLQPVGQVGWGQVWICHGRCSEEASADGGIIADLAE